MEIVTAIFNAVSSAVTGFTSALSSGVSGVVSIFWDSSATTPHLTVVGVLLAITMAIGLVYFGFRLIMRLIRARG